MSPYIWDTVKAFHQQHSAIDQWRKRLKARVKAKGQHFEHLL